MNILSFSTIIPEQICDSITFINYPKEHNISNYCSYASNYIAQVLEDDKIDGAVFPKSCDSTRVLSSYLSNFEKFTFQFYVPIHQDSTAETFLAAEICRYQMAIEKHYGVVIKDIPDRAALINSRNREIRLLYDDLPEISYAEYLSFLHSLLRTPLAEQHVSDTLQGKPCQGKRIFLIGSLLSREGLTEEIERAGLSIVGDRLPESKRLFSAPEVSPMGDIYANIARSMLHSQVSPTQDRFAEILQQDLAEIQAKQVQGVIFVTQKFCEPYDYLFPVYKRMLDEQGIPSLHLSLSGSVDNRNFSASLEAFSEIL